MLFFLFKNRRPNIAISKIKPRHASEGRSIAAILKDRIDYDKNPDTGGIQRPAGEAAYEDYKRLRKENQELQTVKANVDALLRIEQMQEYQQEKENNQEQGR